MSLFDARGRRIAVAMATLLGAAVTASGCAGTSPSAAAVVDGRVVPKSDVEAIANDLKPLMRPGQSPKLEVLLMALVLEPFVQERAKAKGAVVSTDEAKAMIKDEVADPSPQTVRFAQVQKLLQTLDPADAAAVKKSLDQASVTINPRYGSFNPKQYRIEPLKQDWMATAQEPENG